MPTPPLLERNRRAERARAVRRDEILTAARRVFAANGFRGTTIADIAEEAGIALGTIYLYFDSKEDVFAALSQQMNGLIVAALRDVPDAENLDQTVRLRIDNVFAMCAANRDLIRLVVLNTDHDSEAAARMRAADAERGEPMVAAIRHWMEEGVIRAADPAIMTRLTLGLVGSAVYQAFIISDGNDAEQYRVACADMIVAYMTPPPGETTAERAR